MPVGRCSAVSSSLVIVALLAATAPAEAASTETRGPGERRTTLGFEKIDDLARLLTENHVDPLSPFHLYLGASLESISGAVTLKHTQALEAGRATYDHFRFRALREGDDVSQMSAPRGMRVIDADLYFDGEERLIEASLFLEAESSPERALDELIGWIGPPEFEVVMPGGTELLVGWRTTEGLLLGSFSEGALFQLSAFRAEPGDILSGSHLMLYEGLFRYSQDLDAGGSPRELMEELMDVIAWVERARRLIEPR